MKFSTAAKRFAAPLALALLVTGSAMAGTDTTFDTIYNQVKAWAEGSLGKLLAVSAFIVGMGIGLVRQSVMAIVLGLAFALIMFYGPGIMESIVTFAV
jgi:conjugal transfer pilus assembly protein TraA